jgi:hypothetical protein
LETKGGPEQEVIFPDIVETILRSDMVILSKSSEALIAAEVTVPLEDHCSEVLKRKRNKYADLMADCRD